MKPRVEYDLMHLNPEVRNALEMCAPEYFGLSFEGRESQRAAWALSGNGEIRDHLLRHALGKSSQEVFLIDDGGLDLSDYEMNRLNMFTQQIEGVGENFFSWNEYLPCGQTTLSFQTVADYIRALHDCEEQARVYEGISSNVTVHRDIIHGAWVRYIECGKIRYGTLCSRVGFIMNMLETIGADLFKELVPIENVEELEHSVSTGEGLVGPDTGLKTPSLDALKRALSDAIVDLWQRRRDELLAEESQDRKNVAWVIDDNEWFDDAERNYRHIVFASAEAMGNVKIKSFLSDCTAILGDKALLRATVECEAARFKSAVRAAHAKLEKLHLER